MARCHSNLKLPEVKNDKEQEHLEKEMKAHGWTSRVGINAKGKKEWVLIDPQGKPLANA